MRAARSHVRPVRHGMSDMAREIIYPTFVVMLIASVWALGWEKSHTDRLEQGLAPTVPQTQWEYEEVDAPQTLTSTVDPTDE